MKRLIALIVVGVTLGCWGVSLVAADELGFYQQGGVNLNGPAYDWWYGCSPTSAGMMMGYYDRSGYGGLYYNNLVPGGVAEATTFTIANNWNYLANNAIASYGHVTDFYSGGYLASNDDVISSRSFNCLADYMGTSQDAVGNVNGGTTFYYIRNGAKFYASDAYISGVWNIDGMFGMDEYLRYAGYGAGEIADGTSFYTQHIYSTHFPQGCTFLDYKALIDAGLVAMIQVDGHSMFGYGYNDNGQIIFRDTWNDGEHTMDWGKKYSGMSQWGITAFTPSGGQVPLPSSLLLMISGLAGLVGFRLRK